MKVVEVCASEQATPCRNGQRHIVNKYSTHTDGHARCDGGFTPVGGDWAFSLSLFRIRFIVTSEAIYNTYVNAYLTNMRTLMLTIPKLSGC